jgi:hypothetical protein
MGLFDRNDYGRDYRGRRPPEGMRGGRNRPDRWQGAGQRGDHYSPAAFAYRGMEEGWSTAYNRGAHDPEWDWRAAAGDAYDRDLSPRGFRGGRGYDRGFASRGHGYGLDYGRDYRPDPGARARYERSMRGGAGGQHGGHRPWHPFRDLPEGYPTGRPERGGYRGAGGMRYGQDFGGWGRGDVDDPEYRPDAFRGYGRRGSY